MRIITDLPDTIDPIILIEKKVMTCPLCGTKGKEPAWFETSESRRDKNGKRHEIFTSLNTYTWKRCETVECPKCHCKWDTGWYPADRKMFEVDLTADKEEIKDALIEKIEEW